MTHKTSATKKKFCVPPTFNQKKQEVTSAEVVASNSATGYLAPDVIGGCFTRLDWKANEIFDICQKPTSTTCKFIKGTNYKSFCVPKTFDKKEYKIDSTKTEFKDATDLNGWTSPKYGCFPYAGGATKLYITLAVLSTTLYAMI